MTDAAVVLHEDRREIGEDVDWYWRLIQPADGPDVELELAPLFDEWDDAEVRLVLHTIARKLQYVASMLLSTPLTEEESDGGVG